MNQPVDSGSADNRRIIVIVANERDALARVTAALAEEAINIMSIDGHLTGQLGILTLRTSDDDAALLALLKADLRAVTSDAIVFHLTDQPGALANVAQRFSSHQIDVRTIHIMHRAAGHAIVAVTTDNDALARTLLDNDSLL